MSRYARAPITTEEAHDGVVVFEQQSGGRERVLLGKLPIGEIGPVHDPRSRFPVCWSLTLPWAMSMHRLEPANSIEDARSEILEKINDWLQLANLRPNGRRDDD
jgi:hypothetical protein